MSHLLKLKVKSLSIVIMSPKGYFQPGQTHASKMNDCHSQVQTLD
jgi:hypothetical protein